MMIKIIIFSFLIGTNNIYNLLFSSLLSFELNCKLCCTKFYYTVDIGYNKINQT